jgi:mRNA-degrading endonuclease toxin of MazEF toxin-antitoxin module
VLVDQLTAFDSSRLGRSAGTLTWEELGEVDAAIMSVLGLGAR